MNNFIQPILSITIPTFNRASYLKVSLERLILEMIDIPMHMVEIIVSNNASEDETDAVVYEAIEAGLAINYIKNELNIGSDANFAQCFNLARGQYVIIMGDDDQFTDGSLKFLLNELCSPVGCDQYGVVCMRTYAFSAMAESELPRSINKSVSCKVDDFLVKVGHLLTFISGLVINKNIIRQLDAREFCGGQLVQVYLTLRAALRSEKCLYINRYMLACVRSSSPAFDYGKVFVIELGAILDQHIKFGLSPRVIIGIERHMLYTLLPYLALRQRIADVGDPVAMYSQISLRYKNRFLSIFLLKPLLTFPRTLAIIWGAIVVASGRIANGEFFRAYWLVWNNVKLRLNK